MGRAEKKAKRGLNSLKILPNKAAALYTPVGTIGGLFMAVGADAFELAA